MEQNRVFSSFPHPPATQWTLRPACTEALHALRQDWANDSVAADLPAIVAAIQTELSPNVPNQINQVAA